MLSAAKAEVGTSSAPANAAANDNDDIPKSRRVILVIGLLPCEGIGILARDGQPACGLTHQRPWSAVKTRSGVKGKRRRRRPIAAAIAFPIAGATAMIPGSPTP